MKIRIKMHLQAVKASINEKQSMHDQAINLAAELKKLYII